MLFYLGILFFVIIASILYYILSSSTIQTILIGKTRYETVGIGKKLYLFITFSFLTFFSALRSCYVGIDARMYSSLFAKIGDTDDIFSIITSAPIYSIYNKIIYILCPYEQAIIITNSLITLTCIAVFIYTFSSNICLSTILYIQLYSYCMSFNAMRQCLAMSVMLLASCLLKERKLFFCTLLVILAVGIHNTSIFMLIVLFFIPKNLSRNKISIILLCSIAGMLIVKKYFVYIYNFFIELFPRYSMYMENIGVSDSYTKSQGRNVFVTIFFGVIVLVAIILQYASIKGFVITDENRTQIKRILLPCILSVVIGMVWYDNVLLYRIREYFTIFFICLIPNIEVLFKKYRILVSLTVVIVMLVPFVIQLYDNKGGVVPYRFFWEKTIN